MKNLSVTFNVILLLAVVVLYYLHFTGSKSSAANTAEAQSAELTGNIGYIDTDSVISSYTFSKEKQLMLEEKNNSRAANMKNRQGTYENMVRKYQSELPILTEREKAKKEEQIMKLQNELMQMQQQYQQEAMMEETALIGAVVDSLESFFMKYAVEKKLDYVLGYQRNGTIFYKNPKLDLTADVIARLNESYAKSSEKSK
jgi:outer membrane protein